MAKYKIIPSSRTIVQSPISIGHKAEKGVEAIEFDVTAWVETYGSGTLTVIMRRWGDAIPYPIALEIDENNKATWTLSDTDTAKAGMAYAQLSYIVGDTVVKKSDIYTFRVMDSLTGEGEPPEAYESWLEHLTHFAAEAMAEVLDIEGVVTDKTLTVDGGIADAKATGEALAEKVDAADYSTLSARVGANTIALAEKADRSTTYTKAEVDQMIEDVEVETDATLSVSGAPADAKKVGDELSDIKADLGDVFNGCFDKKGIGLNSSKASRGISNTGNVVYDADKTVSFYPVNAGDLIYLNLSANTGTTSAVWEFTTFGKTEDASTDRIVGSVHFDAINAMVRVPSSALYVMVSQPTNATFYVQKVVPINYQEQINNITYGAYEGLKGTFEIGSILNGANSTTTTRIRHNAPVTYDRDLFVFVKSGFKYYIAFYANAEGTSYLYTREFVTNDLPIIIKANTYFRVVICKTTEETVTDIDAYAKAIYVTMQLFNNPQIYRNPLVRQIAHQGLSSDPSQTTGHCLVESYVNAALAGFTHGECDIVFSSNGVPFCCHDSTFTDKTSGNTITIKDHTDVELKTYNYYGGTIATFDEVVKTCKTCGMGVYVDHLDGSWEQEKWNALFAVIQKYDMAKNTFWLIPAISSVLTDPITTWYKDANICRVYTSAPENFSNAVNALKELKTETNVVSFDFYNSAVSSTDIPTYMAQLPPELEMEIWVVDNITEWRAYLPYVSGITSNRICANIARQLT